MKLEEAYPFGSLPKVDLEAIKSQSKNPKDFVKRVQKVLADGRRSFWTRIEELCRRDRPQTAWAEEKREAEIPWFVKRGQGTIV